MPSSSASTSFLYICLETISGWSFSDEFKPEALLRALRMLLQDGDVLAFGAYMPPERLTSTLIGLGATEHDAGSIYRDSFDANRIEHPDGRPYELSVSTAILTALEAEALRPDGQQDKPLFFDHLVAYRRGTPAVPLVCFHDAFYGGELRVSGLYSESSIRAFAAELPSRYAHLRNSENYP